MGVAHLRVRIINAATGELVRELSIDTRQDYQPTGVPKGPTRKTNNPNLREEGSGYSDVLRHHINALRVLLFERMFASILGGFGVWCFAAVGGYFTVGQGRRYGCRYGVVGAFR
jgi:hypothetical protein